MAISAAPPKKWEFDAEVTEIFDDMLTRSIPQYQIMRKAVYDLACHYRSPGTDIVDLGSSRGEALAPLVDRFGIHNRYTAVEVSPPMLEVLRERFGGLIKCSVVDVRNDDLRFAFPPVKASVIMSVLTIQFIPIEYRQSLLTRIYNGLAPGGAFIFVEKVLGETGPINDLMTGLYHKMKADNDYSQEEIARKKLALEGVLVPVTARWNEELLRQAGFRQVDSFWRWMNFAGWMAVKDGSA